MGIYYIGRPNSGHDILCSMLCSRYDVLPLNSPKFNDYIDVIYPKELEIKDTIDAPKWANNLDLHQSLPLMRKVNFSHDSMTSVMSIFHT